MSKRIISIMILIILLALIFSSLSSIGQGHPGGDPGGSEGQTGTITFNDYCSAGSSWDTTITEELAGKTIVSIIFELSWTDDEGSNSQPDTFSLQTNDELNDPKDESSSGGTLTTTWDEERLNNVWNVAVTCDSAGSTEVPVGPLGFITETQSDPGNSWTLVVTYTYSEGGGGPGGPPANVQAVLESPVFKVHIGLMIGSTFLFLGTGLIAGVYIFSRTKWGKPVSFLQKYFTKPTLLYLLVITAFVAFFIASVPIGMWVAGNFYGWNKAWTGFPAMWNPEAWEFTNADNVSFIVLALWAIPVWLNRRQILQSKWYKKLFGWSNFMMARAEKAPKPKLTNKELFLIYFFVGLFVYLVFMVQPHGSG